MNLLVNEIHKYLKEFGVFSPFTPKLIHHGYQVINLAVETRRHSQTEKIPSPNLREGLENNGGENGREIKKKCFSESAMNYSESAMNYLYQQTRVFPAVSSPSSVRIRPDCPHSTAWILITCL